jgi:hypothetical protein
MLNKRSNTTFVFNLTCLLLLSVIVCSGCHRKESTAKNSDDSLAASGDTNGQELVALNELLHKYVLLKKHVPQDISELVTSGFTTNLPAPPPGKRLVIVKNPFGYQVVLKDAN